MDSKTSVHGRRLQQQPQRPVNRQQQQSSGSGEFQARYTPQAGEGDGTSRNTHAGTPV